MKIEKYHAVGTVPNSIRQTVERVKMDTPSIYIYMNSHTPVLAQALLCKVVG